MEHLWAKKGLKGGEGRQQEDIMTTCEDSGVHCKTKLTV